MSNSTVVLEARAVVDFTMHWVAGGVPERLPIIR